MLTSFGKTLRKIRIDLGLMSLRDMAEELQVSPAYLSAVETGKRELTHDFFDKIVSTLSQSHELAGSTLDELLDSASETMTSISVSGIKSKNEMQAAIMFARKFQQDGEDFAVKFKKFLEEESC